MGLLRHHICPHALPGDFAEPSKPAIHSRAKTHGATHQCRAAGRASSRLTCTIGSPCGATYWFHARPPGRTTGKVMHPVRKQRLIFVLFLVFFASAAAALFGFALRENIDLFYAPSTIAAGEAPTGKQIRAGGCVLPGSIERVANSMTKNFVVTVGSANLPVTTEAILPDLFGEGESAVLTGSLNEEGVFVATQVLAKHDET